MRELLQHRRQDREERLDERHHVPIVAGQFAHPAGKRHAARRAKLDAVFPQDRPHHVLDGPHLVQDRAPRDKERSPETTLPAFDVYLPVPSRSHDLGQRPGIVAVRLVRHRLHCRVGLPRLDADGGEARVAQSVVKPCGQGTRLQPDPLQGEIQMPKSIRQCQRIARGARLLHDPPGLVDHTDRDVAFVSDRDWSVDPAVERRSLHRDVLGGKGLVDDLLRLMHHRPDADALGELLALVNDGLFLDLGALTALQYPDPHGRLLAWARGFVRGATTDTLALLKDLGAGVADAVLYQSRDEEGTQSPLATLDRGWGSCRDFAVLFAEAARCLGFGARIVSGYLHAAVPGVVGAQATHAWAEVFVPGAGWITFDPTNRSVGSANLIPVAVARDIRQVVPVAGSFVGASDALLGMMVEVSVSEVADESPYDLMISR